MSGDDQKQDDNQKKPPKPPSKAQMKMAQMMMKVMFKVVKVLIIVSLFLSVLAGLGLAPFLGCYLKYPSQDGTLTTTATVTLYGNGMGALNPIDYNVNTANINYGQWTQVDLAIKGGGSLYFQADGAVSLCKSYYPDTWTQEIPRVGDTTWFNLDLNAADPATTTYNLTEVFEGDLVQVQIGDNAHLNPYAPYSTLYDPVAKQMRINPSANCADGQTSYDSMCGKYTYYYGLAYTPSCNDSYCTNGGDGGGCVEVKSGTCSPEHDNRPAWTSQGYNCGYQTGSHTNVFCHYYYYNCFRYNNGTLYNPYTSSNVFMSGASTVLPSPAGSYRGLCGSVPTITDTWFTFDKINGALTNGALTYSITNSSISNQAVSVIDNCGTTNPAGCHNFVDGYIFDNSTSVGIDLTGTSTSGYMQYKFRSRDAYTDEVGAKTYGSYNGGYVLSLKHTKCYRKNGAYSSDRIYANRGAVRYLILDTGIDPNASTSTSA